MPGTAFLYVYFGVNLLQAKQMDNPPGISHSIEAILFSDTFDLLYARNTELSQTVRIGSNGLLYNFILKEEYL
jgi:hypothetical protein